MYKNFTAIKCSIFHGCTMKSLLIMRLMIILPAFMIPQRSTANLQQAVVTITGTVKEENGALIPGAGVKLKGGLTATTTNTNGQFSIKVQKGQTLTFSSIGFETKEVLIAEQTVIEVVLLKSTSKLNEVVVIGYGQQSKVLVSSAITKVDGKDIGNQPVGTAGEALAGLAEGVQVQSDQGATPGAAPTIRIRGVSSLSSSTEPLYVVDGLPLESSDSFSAMDPNDIESIQILKDAASAAIYGSRAANGVVLVITKRGKAGKTVFSVSAYTGNQWNDKFIPVLNRDQYVSTLIDIFKLQKKVYPTIFDTDPTSLPDVNWQKEIMRTAPISNVAINASGGNNAVRFNTSIGYFKQEGVLLGTNFSRLNVRFNLDADLAKKLKFGYSIAPSYSEQMIQPASGQFSGAGANFNMVGVPGILANLNLPSPLNQALTMPPDIPVYRENGDFAQPSNNSVSTVYYQSNYINPVNVLTQAINRKRTYSTIANAFLNYTPVKGLQLKTYLGGTLDNTPVHSYVPATMAYSVSPTATYSTPSLLGIWASDNNRTSFGWVWENTATYDQEIGKHHFNILGLFSAQKTTAQTNYVAGIPGTFMTATVQDPTASPNTVGTTRQDASDYVSYAARLTYDYNKKYLFTASVRQDGSSKFGPNNRYAVFPAFSAGWRLTEEHFLASTLKKLSVSELKIRGGYGLTGNANIGSFTYTNAITLNKNYASGGTRVYGVQQSGFSNPELTWEKNEQTDIGIDIGLFGNKVNLTADYFNRYSKGMLLNKALPLIVGYATAYNKNVGDLQNQGYEFSAKTIFRINQVEWSVNANLSTYQTKVLDLGGPASLAPTASIFGWNNSYQVKVDDPLGLMYGYVVNGVFKNAVDLANNPQVVAGNKVGDWMIKDVNGDGKIDVNDMTILGHGLPDFSYGITNTFQYKTFDLSILIQGVQGVNVINGNQRQLINATGALNTSTEYQNNYFNPASPERDVKYPQPGSSSSINPQNALVQYFVESGSYLRVRNITLGYKLSNALAKKLFLKACRVYVTAQNPFLFTKYKGYNPETSVNGSNPTAPGVDQGTYPTAHTVIAGINLSF